MAPLVRNLFSDSSGALDKRGPRSVGPGVPAQVTRPGSQLPSHLTTTAIPGSGASLPHVTREDGESLMTTGLAHVSDAV